MTITIAEDFMDVTLTSTNLDSTNQSVQLTVTFNCDDEYESTIDVDDEEIIITNELFSLPTDETLADGVYYFVLKIVQEDGDEITETGCKFVNQFSTCLMLDTFTKASQGDADAVVRAMAFHALVAADGCVSCACSDLCLLYNATKLINCSNDACSTCTTCRH